MREAYQSDLRHIVDDLLDMAEMVGTALEGATASLLEGDLARAEQVVTADPHLDERQVELDAKAVELLARQSPVATDLRLLVATLRMSSSLERMGDLAAHIAKIARMRYPKHAVPESIEPNFQRMAVLATEMTEIAGRTLRERNILDAEKMADDDEEMDTLRTMQFT